MFRVAGASEQGGAWFELRSENWVRTRWCSWIQTLGKDFISILSTIRNHWRGFSRERHGIICILKSWRIGCEKCVNCVTLDNVAVHTEQKDKARIAHFSFCLLKYNRVCIISIQSWGVWCELYSFRRTEIHR